jgi:GTPase SAR1 family protein
MKWADTQLKVKESAGDYGVKISVYWAKFVDRITILYRFLRAKFTQLDEWIRQTLGLTEAQHINVQKTNIATLLHETELKFQQLPFIYRRLFDFKRDVEASFYIRNAEFFETTTKAFDLWNTGFPSSIVLIGEKGSGKSTLVRFLKNEVFDGQPVEEVMFNHTVYQSADLLASISKQLKLDKQDNVQDLVKAINKRRKRSIIVVENIQNCFVRHVNGYEAMSTLLYLIAETREKILWVVTVSRYAWSFLDVVTKISDYFSHSVMVGTKSEQGIEQLILKRQKASGYQVLFHPDPSTAKSRAYKKTLTNLDSEQEFLQTRFFENLYRIAEGNATVAMIFWIRSIKKVEESHFVIEPFDFNGIDYLAELDANSLFILSAFILHDTLDAEHLAMIMRISPTASEMIISRLRARGLLVFNGTRYCLNDMMYRQIVRLLKSRNILN